MTRTRWLVAMLTTTLLLTPALAAAHGSTVAFYLYRAGEPMTTGTPTNEDPTGLWTLVVEREGQVYSALTQAGATGTLRIATSGSFHLRLDERERLSPTPQDMTTDIRLLLFNGPHQVRDGSSVYHLARATRTFAHPGGEVGDAADWTDFHFDANARLPTANHCNANGCVRHESGALVVPAGFRIGLEVGLVLPSDCAADACAATSAAARVARESYRQLLHDAHEATGVNPWNPLGLSSFDPVNNTLDPPLRALEEGSPLRHLLGGSPTPSSTWRSASTTSDSRLEIRLA